MRFFQRAAQGPAELRTARLRLVAITPAMMAAETRADGSLAKLLKVRMTGEWPPEHWERHVFEIITEQLVEEPGTAGWHRYVVLPDARGWGRASGTLIGCVGGFPRPEGEVEIGYSTLPEFQRRGYGTEAAVALVEWLLAQEGVRSVSAQTYPRLPESIKVMERCGMSFAGPGDEDGAVKYRRLA
jgi:ribosomal-protein-alanine N-acetyltransferase